MSGLLEQLVAKHAPGANIPEKFPALTTLDIRDVQAPVELSSLALLSRLVALTVPPTAVADDGACTITVKNSDTPN